MTPTTPIKTRNAAATRLAILSAAHDRFLQDGYDQAGVRAIAADAGVDAALICRYFGSKERLFAEVLERTSEDPMAVLAGERSTFGERVARAVLDPGERRPERIAFLQLAARSSTSPVASRLVRMHIESRFIVPFSAWLGGAGAAEKAWLAASVLVGVGVIAGIEQAAPPSSASADAVPPPSRASADAVPPPSRASAAAVERLAKVLQSLIDA